MEKNQLKTAILYSGGKDSTLALQYALKYTHVKCLVIMISKNRESYMFHTPNIYWAEKQAEAIGIPSIVQYTEGEKETELKDLKKVIRKAINKYNINGVVTGAVGSIYQTSRIQKICCDLNIECFNPLWQKDQIELLKNIIENKYEVMIVGTFALGLKNYVSRKIDKKFVDDMKVLNKKYMINPAGEGGEYESFVTYAPFFKKKIEIKKSHMVNDKDGGQLLIIDKIEV